MKAQIWQISKTDVTLLQSHPNTLQQGIKITSHNLNETKRKQNKDCAKTLKHVQTENVTNRDL